MANPEDLILEDICPECGRHLITREGKNSDFIGCTGFPNCRYTRSWPLSETLHGLQPYCKKCNHTGLIPSPALGKFSGKPIPGCFTRCECNQEEPDYYRRITPADFDFPVSWDFHRFISATYGKGDPGDNETPPFERGGQASTPKRAQVMDPEWTQRQQYQVDQLRAEVLHLQNKVEELLKKKSGKKAVKKWD